MNNIVDYAFASLLICACIAIISIVIKFIWLA